MYIFGASGHGKVIASLLRVSNADILKGFLDDNPIADSLFGLPVYHAEKLQELQNASLLVAIGNNENRKKVAARIGGIFFNAIHPSSQICSSVRMGLGNAIMPNAVINADTVLGNHCIVNSGAVVEHDCVIEDYVHISPNSALAGGIRVGEGAHIGIGASLLPGITIGKWSVIGAGAVILHDVPDFSVVVGVPGRIIKQCK